MHYNLKKRRASRTTDRHVCKRPLHRNRYDRGLKEGPGGWGGGGHPNGLIHGFLQQAGLCLADQATVQHRPHERQLLPQHCHRRPAAHTAVQPRPSQIGQRQPSSRVRRKYPVSTAKRCRMLTRPLQQLPSSTAPMADSSGRTTTSVTASPLPNLGLQHALIIVYARENTPLWSP